MSAATAAHARPDCYPTHCEPGAPCPRHAVAKATLTVSDLIDALAQHDPDRPVLIGHDGWYLNVDAVESDPDAPALTIEARDDFDTRQW